MSNTTFDSIYIFCAIWNLGNLKIVLHILRIPRLLSNPEIAHPSRLLSNPKIAHPSRLLSNPEIAQHMSTISRSRDSHVQSIIMSELSTFPVYLTAHRSSSEVNRHLLLPFILLSFIPLLSSYSEPYWYISMCKLQICAI